MGDLPTHLLFSQHLRAVGRLMLRELRARHVPVGFARLLTRILRQPGKLLGRPIMEGQVLETQDMTLWPLLALLAAASAADAPTTSLANMPRAFWARAHAIAAAAEFLGAALDVFDDIQDGDNPLIQQMGTPLALNAGVVLLELAPLAMNRARSADWPDAIADAALEIMHNHTLTVMVGQFRDLQFEGIKTVSETQVMEMTEQKSGTLVSLVCRLGAMAGAGASKQRPVPYFEAAGFFGWHLGVWSQLLNDLHDAEQEQTQARKSDRERGKKTLPLVLEQHGIMLADAAKGEQERLANTQAAFAYTYVVAERFRLRAQQALRTMEEGFGPHPLLWPLIQRHQAKDTEQPAEHNRLA